MKYRSLDLNGDYSFGKNAQNFLTDAQAVAQAIKTRLLLFKGEWWEDTSDGLPVFQNILGVPGTDENLKAIDLIVQQRILSTKGVSKIDSFSSTYEDRKYTASYVITTDDGETVTSEVSL